MKATQLVQRLEAVQGNHNFTKGQKDRAALLVSEVYEDMVDSGGDFDIRDVEQYLGGLLPPPHDDHDHIDLIND